MTARQKALRAARNQRFLLEYIEELIAQRGPCVRLTEGMLREMHRITIGDMYPCAGNYRDAHYHVTLNGRSVPPAYSVRYSVRDLLDQINRHPPSDHVRKAARFHYRLTEIHPFNGGNGRVARALMCLLLRCGDEPQFVIVELLGWIRRHRQPYIDSLRAGERNFSMFLLYGLLCVYEKDFRRLGPPGRLRSVRSVKSELRRRMKPVVSQQLSLF